MRILFVVPPLTGHVNPTVSVAQALSARGHTVAWVAHPGAVGPLLPPGATLLPLDDRVPQALQAEMVERARATRGLAALKFLWEDFLLPLARAMVPGVEQAVAQWRPDLLVVDQQALAGGIVARRRDLPWATFATTSAGVSAPLAGLPKVQEWLDQQLLDLQQSHGLPALPTPDLSPHAVVVFSTAALMGPVPLPPTVHLVGPAFVDRPDRAAFPWERLSTVHPRLLVSLGTVNAERGARFFGVVVQALAEEPVQVILAAPPEVVGPVPPSWIVQPWVPQVRLLPQVQAVIGHGGHNTTCEALAAGLPLVLAPIRDDQPVVAEQVVAAGAGLRVRFGRVGPDELRTATWRVLREPAFRQAAATIAASFAAAGGAQAAAGVLEDLVSGRLDQPASS
jgi:MGT family glycosyltransferase